jgi:hypothetical protein
MKTTPISTTAINYQKLRQAEAALSELVAEALKRGFFGTAVLEIAVQDGTIQHIRRCLDRVDK